MKEEIHPEWYPDAKVIVNGEVVMTVGSTKPELHVEIWSGTHPFYTGQQRLVDTEGQVERFLKRLQRRQEIQEETEEQDAAESPLAFSVDVVPMNVRSQNAIKEAGLTTVADLVERLTKAGDDGLLSITGVGQKALIDVKRYLRAEGLIE